MPSRRRRTPTRRLPMHPEWEWVAADTERLEIPGGWLYRTARKEKGLAVCFVPRVGDAAKARARAVRASSGPEMMQKLDQLRTLLNELGGHARARRQLRALQNMKVKRPNGGSQH